MIGQSFNSPLYSFYLNHIGTCSLLISSVFLKLILNDTFAELYAENRKHFSAQKLDVTSHLHTANDDSHCISGAEQGR